MAGTYATIEPFIPSGHDLIIQKIGKIYKAYQRQSKSPGQWHHACGEVTIDRVAVTETHKMWLDCAAELFGGLDLVSLTCLEDPQQHPNDHIIMKINGSWMSLFELENVQYISDIIWHRLCTTVRRTENKRNPVVGVNSTNIGQAESVGTGLSQRYSQSSASIQNQGQSQGQNLGQNQGQNVQRAPASRNVSAASGFNAPQNNIQSSQSIQGSNMQSNNNFQGGQNYNTQNSNNPHSRSKTQSMPVSPDHNKTIPGQLPQGEESAEKIRQIRQSFANFFN